MKIYVSSISSSHKARPLISESREAELLKSDLTKAGLKSYTEFEAALKAEGIKYNKILIVDDEDGSVVNDIWHFWVQLTQGGPSMEMDELAALDKKFPIYLVVSKDGTYLIHDTF